MDNLHIYDAGRSVPETAVKKITGGAYGAAGLSDINPQWRIEKLTEIFGACGVGWYFEPEVWVSEGVMYGHVQLFHKLESGEWSKPVHGYGGTKLTGKDDDAAKSTVTDALGNACRYLGIGADVWFPQTGSPRTPQFDTKYSAPPPAPATDPTPMQRNSSNLTPAVGEKEKPCDPKQVQIICNLSTPDELKALKKLYGESFERLSLGGAVKVIAIAREKKGA